VNTRRFCNRQEMSVDEKDECMRLCTVHTQTGLTAADAEQLCQRGLSELLDPLGLRQQDSDMPRSALGSTAAIAGGSEALQRSHDLPENSLVLSEQAAATPKFELFDKDGDGVLCASEVAVMMESLGYVVDDSYLQGVMNTFGYVDANGVPGIEPEDFDALYSWFHSGGCMKPATADTMRAEVAKRDAHGDDESVVVADLEAEPAPELAGIHVKPEPEVWPVTIEKHDAHGYDELAGIRAESAPSAEVWPVAGLAATPTAAELTATPAIQAPRLAVSLSPDEINRRPAWADGNEDHLVNDPKLGRAMDASTPTESVNLESAEANADRGDPSLEPEPSAPAELTEEQQLRAELEPEVWPVTIEMHGARGADESIVVTDLEAEPAPELAATPTAAELTATPAIQAPRLAVSLSPDEINRRPAWADGNEDHLVGDPDGRAMDASTPTESVNLESAEVNADRGDPSLEPEPSAPTELTEEQQLAMALELSLMDTPQWVDE
jgi:hypothetical protein